MERTILRANAGMVLTDGQVYGKVIFLAEGVDATAFQEITEAAYGAIMAAEAKDEI